MSYVKLEFPILVQTIQQNDKPHYLLKPLFVPSPTVMDRRYESAMRRISDEVTQRLKGAEIHRDTIDNVLWYSFNPELQFTTNTFKFTVGRQFFNGPISYGVFKIKDLTFICLPSFQHFIFIANTDKKEKPNIRLAVESAVKQYLKLERKEAKENIDFDPFYAKKGEFITTVSQTLKIKQGVFRSETSNEFFFFDSLSPSSDFDGGTEIEKVGSDLLRNYPEKLLRTFHREVLVERLMNSMYHSENTPIVLVGREGVGKHSLIHEAIYRYRAENSNKNIEHLQSVWHLDPTRIISGMSVVGWWQKRFEAILTFAITRRDELVKNATAGKIVFDNIVALLRIGKSSQNNMTLSDVLKPYLEKRKLQTIQVATP